MLSDGVPGDVDSGLALWSVVVAIENIGELDGRQSLPRFEVSRKYSWKKAQKYELYKHFWGGYHGEMIQMPKK